MCVWCVLRLILCVHVGLLLVCISSIAVHSQSKPYMRALTHYIFFEHAAHIAEEGTCTCTCTCLVMMGDPTGGAIMGGIHALYIMVMTGTRQGKQPFLRDRVDSTIEQNSAINTLTMTAPLTPISCAPGIDPKAHACAPSPPQLAPTPWQTPMPIYCFVRLVLPCT